MNEIKIFSFACVLGGFLRIVACFVESEIQTDVVELLYIATDLCLILGLVGFYSVYRKDLFYIGHLGFITTLCGFSFIAGPETKLFGLSVYQLGSPVIGVGILFLSFNLIKANLCGLLAPVSLVASVLLGLISMMVVSDILFVLTGILFGFGFIVLGANIWRNN